jgi:hypothetical protein
MYRKRVISVLAGAVLAASAMLASLAVATPAQAATGITTTPFAGTTALLQRTLAAGDCRLVGVQDDAQHRGSGVRLVNDQVFVNGLAKYTLTWGATAFTQSTFFGDVWHATFIFRAQNGATVQSPTLDSPTMFAGNLYRFAQSVDIFIDPNTLGSSPIVSVTWRGDC